MGSGRSWLIGLVIVALVAVIGVYTYNLGVAQGIAESSRVGTATGTVPVVVWPRPWGFGFGFFPFFPLLFILFALFAFRGLCWRGAWRGRGYGGVPPAFEEWHRRAHERQEQPPAPAAKA
jgi:hypothetical protein